MVQSHLLGSNVYCAMAGLLTRTPVVTTFHGSVDIGERERFKWLKFAAINAGARCVVAVSEDLKDDILKRTPLRSWQAVRHLQWYRYLGISAAELRPASPAIWLGWE